MEQVTNVKQHVFIIGSKGIPAKYGGFETFVEKLTFYQKSLDIQYHVSCLVNPDEDDSAKREFEHNGAHCFNIKDLNIGAAKAIFYDINALKYCIEYIKKNDIQSPIIYILACRIGPFIGYYKQKINKLGGHLFVNPDGHEWKRAKWSAPVRKYWKISERLMVKHADLLICDSVNIEQYIQQDYSQFRPLTTFISYGSDTVPSRLAEDNEEYLGWLEEKGLKAKSYYLIVGRFVPENNFEIMIREFMRSSTKKDLAIIATPNDAFLNKLEMKLQFRNDPRIKFVGTVYNDELLKKIREDAYGYFHGHEVGGTNPSLLEALSSTNLNLLLDVGFNKEVGQHASLYWSKEAGNLAVLIDKADLMNDGEIQALGVEAKIRIAKDYSWPQIVNRYEKKFLSYFKID